MVQEVRRRLEVTEALRAEGSGPSLLRPLHWPSQGRQDGAWSDGDCPRALPPPGARGVWVTDLRRGAARRQGAHGQAGGGSF